MSCCRKNNNYYARPNQYNDCGCGDLCNNYTDCAYSSDCACNDNFTLTGGAYAPGCQSCDCCGDRCYATLKDALCRLVNQKVIIYSGGCKMCVIIVEVCDCFLKAINFSNNRVIYFNLNRIDNIEDILP